MPAIEWEGSGMSDDIDQVSDEIPEWDDAPWQTAL
jgi:hypothetical protein